MLPYRGVVKHCNSLSRKISRKAATQILFSKWNNVQEYLAPHGEEDPGFLEELGAHPEMNFNSVFTNFQICNQIAYRYLIICKTHKVILSQLC